MLLHDDNNLSKKIIQVLSYYLCHSYARCTKTMAMPICVYYAQLLAQRGRYWLRQQGILSYRFLSYRFLSYSILSCRFLLLLQLRLCLGYNDEMDTQSTRSGGSSGSGSTNISELNNKLQVHEKLRMQMFFC